MLGVQDSHISWRSNSASYQDIEKHLIAVDGDFVPPLTTRVHLPDYSRKLATRAHTSEAWVDGELVGLVATYLPGSSSSSAFISSVSTDVRYRGRRIAPTLIVLTATVVVQHGGLPLELEVNETNRAALATYQSLGFTTSRRRGADLVLRAESLAVSSCRAVASVPGNR